MTEASREAPEVADKLGLDGDECLKLLRVLVRDRVAVELSNLRFKRCAAP